MSTRETFVQLLLNIEPKRWQLKDRCCIVEAGDALITVSPDIDRNRYYATISKRGTDLYSATFYRGASNMYPHLQACEEAAMANNAKMIDQVMDEFACVTFGVGDTKSVPSISFDIERCAPAEA